MKELILGRTQQLLIQLFRYVLVGGFAAAVDTGCLLLLRTKLGIHYLTAAAVGFLLGLVTNYVLSVLWVFESSGSLRREFTLFALIGAGGLLWTELILWISIDLLNRDVLFSKVVALILVLGWNFFMRRQFVFSETAKSREQQ